MRRQSIPRAMSRKTVQDRIMPCSYPARSTRVPMRVYCSRSVSVCDPIVLLLFTLASSLAHSNVMRSVYRKHLCKILLCSSSSESSRYAVFW
ncbi:hypothetical protein OE88DRAFT_929854 [Heliocybe sulcata]|uniref:Uncharacterized protein n=1 Tax=Heliocybe sulcata TaxID=5364 RepID=A0A5C3MPJ5_9AGAM|nr:hypothetical protein OE88DRAFT_929854 [Heliocybe sulcata]